MLNFFKRLKNIIKIGTDNDKNREKWLIDVLKRIPAGSRILDAGAGKLRFKPFCSYLKYVSQDFARYNGQGDGAGLQMGQWSQSNLDIVSDITQIPQPNDQYDAILCTEVFEHIPDPNAAIKEFYRLLKKGGQLIITAPFCCGTHFAPFYYYSGFSKYFYENYLLQYDFEIKEIKYNGNFFDYIAQEIRRMPTMAKAFTNTKVYLWEYLILFMNLLILRRISKKI